MNIEPHSLDPVASTMLMTLAARAAASAIAPDTEFNDPWGNILLNKLPWDLTAYQEDHCFVRHVALRAGLIDLLTAGFFLRNPGSLGIGLGSGLCSRSRRIFSHNINFSPFSWIDLDVPDVIDIRRSYLPPLPGEKLLSGSLTDLSWLQDIFQQERGPVILVMEGVSPYLSEEENRCLFQNLAQRLEGTHTEMIFDYIHPSLVDSPYVKNEAAGMSTPFVSGFSSTDEITSLHPSIRIISEHSTFSQVSPRHKRFEMEFEAASLGEKPYNILHIKF